MHRSEDSLLASARREALLVFGIWLVACVYSVGVCYWLGYGRDITTLTYVLGFPDWVFWGIVVPWSVCTGLCFIVPRFLIKDEDLGEEQAEEAVGQAALPVPTSKPTDGQAGRPSYDHHA